MNRPRPFHLLLLCLAAMLCSPAFSMAEAPPLRVMSYNVRFGTAKDGDHRWEARKSLLIRNIADFKPDLLAVQEALGFQTKEILEALPGYTFIGVGRDEGQEKGEYTGIYFRADRFEKLDEGHFWLSEKPEEPGSISWDSSLTRMASWVKLREKTGGAELLFLNTHFDHRGAEARLESARLIRRKVQELQPGGPIVVAGDFNTTEDAAPYKEFLRTSEADPLILRDSYRVKHPQRAAEEATFHGFKGTRAGSRIDWILHTPHFETVEAAIDRTQEGGIFPSDHYAVTAVLRWAAAAGQP